MYVLGVSSNYHDSAAVLIKDGIVVAAYEEERFSRVKHDNSFPERSAQACLKKAHITIKKVDVVAYYEKPLLKFERIIETCVRAFPRSLPIFTSALVEWLSYKITVEKTIRDRLNFKKPIAFVPHHLSHASSTYYTSGFTRSAVLTVDGVGEYQTTTIAVAKNNTITPLKEINFPNSLGLFYSTFTSYLGFTVNEGEYKLMALAAYGKPVYVSKIRKIITQHSDTSFELNPTYFSFESSFSMYSNEFISLFGKPRTKDEKIEKRHRDIAASVQYVLQQFYLNLVGHTYKITGEKNICIGGGVALNAVANGMMQKEEFENIHIYGPSGDSGAALGAALFCYHKISNTEFTPCFQKNLQLGSSYKNNEIKKLLRKKKLKALPYSIKKIASLLKKEKIVALFQGEMEFGPRALGGRSLLAHPSYLSVKRRLMKIKHRESFRPFAVSILSSHVREFFPGAKNTHYPYMNYCFHIKKNKRKSLSAAVHIDNTVRIQTVDASQKRYFSLLRSFYQKTTIPAIINTSFNDAGEPLVESPEQAIDFFLKSDIDALAIEDYLLIK